MIFLVLYIAAVWIAAFWLRRKPVGYALALLSVVPVAAVFLIARAVIDPNHAVAPAMVALPASYAALVCIGALVIVHQPRRPPFHCLSCGYDLEHNVLDVCPECGAPAPTRAIAPLAHGAARAADDQRPAA